MNIQDKNSFEQFSDWLGKYFEIKNDFNKKDYFSGAVKIISLPALFIPVLLCLGTSKGLGKLVRLGGAIGQKIANAKAGNIARETLKSAASSGVSPKTSKELTTELFNYIRETTKGAGINITLTNGKVLDLGEGKILFPNFKNLDNFYRIAFSANSQKTRVPPYLQDIFQHGSYEEDRQGETLTEAKFQDLKKLIGNAVDRNVVVDFE